METREEIAEEMAKVILQGVGHALLTAQTIEKALKRCIALLALPLSLEEFEAEQEAVKKQTLGYFITELGKRVELETQFAAELASFLKNRNDLAHNFLEVTGYKMSTGEGCERAFQLVTDLMRQSK